MDTFLTFRARPIALVERYQDERGLLSRFRITYQNNARIARFLRDAKGNISEWEDYEE